STFGAPMGRKSWGLENINKDMKIFDSAVELNSGGYDKGGAYWGLPSNLRVRYTKDLSYVRFYRLYDSKVIDVIRLSEEKQRRKTKNLLILSIIVIDNDIRLWVNGSERQVPKNNCRTFKKFVEL